MLRLVVSDLVRNPRPWIGLIAVSVAVSAVSVFAIALFAQASDMGEDRAAGFFMQIGIFICIGTGVAVLVVVSGASTLIMTLRRRTIALWKAVGLLPRHVFWITLSQLAIASAVGAVIGAVVGVCGYVPMYEYGFETLDGLDLPRPVVAGWVPFVAIAIVVGITTLGSTQGARRAASTEVVALLREAEPRRAKGRWIRSIVAVLMVGLTIGAAASTSNDFQAILQISPLLAPMLVIAVTLAGPLVYRLVIRAWTSVIPARWAPSWFLARNSASFRVSFSAAAIGPLIVALVLVADVYSVGATLATMPGSDLEFDVPASQMAIMFGGPLLVSIVAAAAAVYVTGSDRTRERALLKALGARPITLVRAAMCEAIIFALTSVAIAVAILFTAMLLVHVAAQTERIVLDPAPIATIGGFGLLLLLVATTVPTFFTRRDSSVQVLAAE